MIKNTSPENAADIETMVGVLEKASIGETVNYGAMDAALGRPSRNTHWLIRKAIRQVEKDTGAIFEIVRGVGIKRLPSSDIPSVGTAAIRKIRRASKRAVARLQCVRVNDLGHDEAKQVIAQRAQLATISFMADGRKTPAITAEINEDKSTLPVGRVLEVFGRN
ncbi:MAG: hypothetical protein VX464_20880 [Pseudomonadota bacterium]|nr:hypothetical protein [Pseudomonadota bacterium]